MIIRTAPLATATIAFLAPGALLVATPSGGGASAPPTSSIVASQVPVPSDTDAGWFIVSGEADCTDTESRSSEAVLTVRHAVCVDTRQGQTVTGLEHLVAVPRADDPADVDTSTNSTVPTTPSDEAAGQSGPAETEPEFLRLIPELEWGADTLPSAEAAFTIVSAGSERRIRVRVVPDVRLDIEYVVRSDAPTMSATTTTTASTTTAGTTPVPENTTVATSAAASEPAQSDALSEAVVLSHRTSVTKTIRVVGADADIDGLAISEQLQPSQFRALVDGQELEPEENATNVRLELDGSSVTYELRLAPGANFGAVTTTQRTALVLDGIAITDEVTEIALDAPRVDVHVQALAVIVGGEQTVVSVRVTNLRPQPIDGPLVIRLGASAGGDLIRRFADLGGGDEDQNEVVWLLPTGMEADGEVVRTIVAELNAGGSTSRIEWRGALQVEGASVPIASETTPSDIRVDPVRSTTAVDFTPGQLIRLIAFVMAFALVAIIFGAWTRRSCPGEDSRSREAELLRFQTYTETILVLVVLVAVLVLALRESLSGESAASLIGVIAGYAFGRGRQRT